MIENPDDCLHQLAGDRRRSTFACKRAGSRKLGERGAAMNIGSRKLVGEKTRRGRETFCKRYISPVGTHRLSAVFHRQNINT